MQIRNLEIGIKKKSVGVMNGQELLFIRSRTISFFKDETSCCPLYLVVPMLRDYKDAASIRANDFVSFS
ncbi:hypothetical protein [Flavobacterium sp. LB1P62]|uniref:hypothetical protein n=1 Tax=Flavobacterium sp. LB1P62 TaxID=3401715 RepID=UPI003AAE2440